MDITKIITDSIQNTPPEKPRRYVGASGIGHDCMRSIWYSYKGYDGTKINPALQITFEIGRRLEAMILDYMEQAGLTIERPSEFNGYLFCSDPDVREFEGHADGLLWINDVAHVLEIKTAKSSSFKKFKEQGLMSWSKTYYAQVQAYMGMLSLGGGLLLAVNKDTSELHHEWVNFDDIFYDSLVAKADMIACATREPERINNNTSYFLCQNCRFKTICHAGE